MWDGAPDARPTLAMATEPLPAVGSQIGSYRVDALLGRGGMGVVYRAEDLRLGRKVALKLLVGSLADDPTYRERFLRESRLAASIEHAGIVPVFEAGEADGLLYIAMRFVDGVDLAALLRREGQLEPERAVALVGQLAGALDAAHARGLIHRDVKPSNALIGTDTDGEHAYLADFGITQDLADGDRLTATDQLVGTANYLAPEGIRGGAIDHRADIYALGCVLFECLTGSPPFAGTSEAAIIYGHLEEPPPRASAHRAGLPEALDDVIARALAKDPAERFQSGAQLRAAAQQALAGAPSSRAHVRPRRRALLAATAVAAIALAVTGVLALGRGDAPGPGTIDENALGVIDAKTGRLTAQYDLGRPPKAVISGGGSLWVANGLDGTVSRVPRGRREVVTIDVGGEPTALAYGAGSLWVADGQGRTVAQVAPETNRVVQRFDVGNAARAVAVGSGALWVASAVDATVTRIDLERGGAKRQIPVDAGPTAIAAGAGGIWVASEDTGRVVELDPRTGAPLGSVAVGNGPSAIAVGPGAVWVANRTDGTVSRIDPETGAVGGLLLVGGAPSALVADERGVWVANSGDQTVVHVDSRTLTNTATVRIGSTPAGLTLVDGEVWTATAEAPGTHRGGTLRVSAGGGGHVDPISGSWMHGLAYDSLVGYRRAGGASGGTLVAGLATTVPDAGPDGLTYRFRLRPNVRFSNGAPVTPRDVRASLERLLALGDPEGNDDLTAIRGAKRCKPNGCDLSDGIEIDQAARTVTLHLSRPDPEFLHKLHAVFITPASSPRKLMTTTPLPGTGPYMIERWDSKRGGLLVRNPHFHAWSPDRPDGFPERIEVRFASFDAQVAAVDRGTADVALMDIATPEASALRVRYGPRLHTDPTAATIFAFLNVDKPPFNDARVRRALNYAVDRGRLAELLGSRQTHVPTCQLLPPGFPGYTPACPFTVNRNPAGTWTGPDLERARRLIAASGTRGMKVEFWGVHGLPLEPVGRYFRSVLGKLGYRASLHTIGDLHPIGVAASGPPATRPQLGLWGWGAISAAPYTFAAPVVSCAGVVNHSHICDRKLDALMTRAENARGVHSVELWRQVEAHMARQAPIVPLFNPGTVSLAARRVGNWQHNPIWGPLPDQMWVK